jgi:hypothetical protein
MTTTLSRFDLRDAFTDSILYAAQTDDPQEESEADESGEADETSEPEDVETLKAHWAKQEQKLKKEAGKWRTRYREAQQALADLGADTDGPGATSAPDATDATVRAEAAETALTEARIRLAFMQANDKRTEPFKDVDLALSTCDFGAVKVNDDGTVEGLTEAMDYAAKKFPYLVDDSKEETEERELPDKPSGRSVNRRRKSMEHLTPAALAKKYPALRRR